MFKKTQHKTIEEVDYDDMTDEEFFKLMYKKKRFYPVYIPLILLAMVGVGLIVYGIVLFYS